MVSTSGNLRGGLAKSRFLIALRFLFPAFAFSLSHACTVNKTPLENARLFTADELQKKGVLLVPVAADAAAQEELGSGDYLVFDRVFESVMQQQWEERKIAVLNTRKSLANLPPDDIEAWRATLAKDRLAPPEEVLDLVEDTYGDGPFLLVSGRLLANQVSCGTRDPLPSYNKSAPAQPVAYCQCLLKVQFQIYDRERKEKVWNGLIYASDEASEKFAKGRPPKENPRPPGTEVLIREAFKNFANMMAGTLEGRP